MLYILSAKEYMDLPRTIRVKSMVINKLFNYDPLNTQALKKELEEFEHMVNVANNEKKVVENLFTAKIDGKWVDIFFKKELTKSNDLLTEIALLVAKYNSIIKSHEAATSIMSRYAEKQVNPKYYQTIKITNILD